MKRSDNPLSPFNENWVCPIRWADLNKAAVYSSSQSKVVNESRGRGKELAVSVPFSTKGEHTVADPRVFFVQLSKATNGKNKRAK